MKLAAAGLALAAALALAAPPVIRMCASFGGLRHVAALLVLAVLGGLVYGGAVIAMFGSRWIAGLRRRRARAAL
jgi:putative peptidoglycan lipid II flippase